MTELTHFQEIMGMALDIEDANAAKVQKNWPETEEDLRKSLRQWKRATSAEIKGFELLSIVSEVWKHRPAKIEDVQGRTVLYHPMDGSPIPEGSPMDGLNWEILAFLRWATQQGHLQWSDEITISREVKAVGGLIVDLPIDRFHMKNMLPKANGGAIDWSDVSLAQSKAFVLHGDTTTEQNWQRVHPANEKTLAGALAQINALNNTDARTMLLRGLPAGSVGTISRNSAPGTDLYNIVAAAEGYGMLSNGKMAINVLIDNAMRMVGGTALGNIIDRFRL